MRPACTVFTCVNESQKILQDAGWDQIKEENYVFLTSIVTGFTIDGQEWGKHVAGGNLIWRSLDIKYGQIKQNKKFGN